METANTILRMIAEGGPTAIIAILVVIIALLGWERRETAKALAKTTELVYEAKDSETKSIKEIVDKYHQGNVDLIQALNEIRVVLSSIQNNSRK
jgi:NADH:ubiquinone oxidoreductase subunit E